MKVFEAEDGLVSMMKFGECIRMLRYQRFSMTESS